MLCKSLPAVCDRLPPCKHKGYFTIAKWSVIHENNASHRRTFVAAQVLQEVSAFLNKCSLRWGERFGVFHLPAACDVNQPMLKRTEVCASLCVLNIRNWFKHKTTSMWFSDEQSRSSNRFFSSCLDQRPYRKWWNGHLKVQRLCDIFKRLHRCPVSVKGFADVLLVV